MAGSQLKQLKAALKANGLIGQTNIKKKNKKSKTPSETRRNDKHEILNNIRKDFNLFDGKVNRTKRDVTMIQGGKFVKVGSKQHNDATRAKSDVEKSMKLQYELDKKQNGKTGGLIDRRFGENNRNLTAEEKMLERFTRERQGNKKKFNFALGSDDEQDDEDNDGFVLTHSGKSLSLDNDLDDTKLGASNTKYYDEDSLMPEEAQPKRKSKQEVMKEVIAKSKFYKHQRQMEFQKAQDEIMNLDDEFGDIMTEFNNNATKKSPNFSTKTPEEIEYDNKVRELTYDRRSVPADRTKTAEELQKEHDTRLQKLEADRLRRMNGDFGDREAEADDLDGFWNGSADEEEGFAIENSDEEEEGSSGSEGDIDQSKPSGRTLKKTTVQMPGTHEDFIASLSTIEDSKHCNYINKVIETYQPRLAEGNKERMNVFVGILFKHILYLANELNPPAENINEMMKILKKLSESYNEKLVEAIRIEINDIQSRIFNLQPRDLVYFVIIGYLFSTSDHYHLVVTPTLILMNENISSIPYDKTTTINQIGQGLFIVDILLNYQTFSKRFTPEIVCFLEKAALLLLPDPEKLANKSLSVYEVIKSDINLSTKGIKPTEDLIKVSELFGNNTQLLKLKLTNKLIDIFGRILSIWRDNGVMVEILSSFSKLASHLAVYYKSPKLDQLTEKMSKIQNNLIKERKPLALQHHKAISIATFAPKFEENFNPDKKSYDVNRERQEMNKIKNQIKKERKSALKDIRKESKFTARQQIAEKKDKYDEYHKKMANIVNSISTIEGAEKNTYEREKQRRKNK
ncbi:unnamed protein product [Debaryomyces fabryi]|nr:unnamed protein product [Debaryomyces fabryi]